MGSFSVSELRKGRKIQIDGEPYLVVEYNFVKPGKGQALYKCRIRSLIRGTVIDRTWKSNDSFEDADVTEVEGQYLYRQGEQWVFMDNSSFEQYELGKDVVDESWKWLKEGMVCNITLFNDRPISIEAPYHVVLKVEYAEPAVRGNTATNLTKPVKLETGAEIVVPAFVEQGEMIRVDTRTGEYIERVRE